MAKVSNIKDKRGKILIPVDEKSGYLVDEHTLRMFCKSNRDFMSLGNGTRGSHNEFIKCLIVDYIKIYRKLESLNELTM